MHNLLQVAKCCCKVIKPKICRPGAYKSIAWLRPCTLLPKYKISTSGTGTFWRENSGSPRTVLAWYTLNMATVPLFWYTKATATRTAKGSFAYISKITTVGIAYFLLPLHDDEQKLSNFTQFYGVREHKITIFFSFSLTEI